MSKGLRNIKDRLERINTIERRLREGKGGLGYLAACDAKAKLEEYETTK